MLAMSFEAKRSLKHLVFLWDVGLATKAIAQIRVSNQISMPKLYPVPLQICAFVDAPPVAFYHVTVVDLFDNGFSQLYCFSPSPLISQAGQR